ncbi:MAG: hypothetical protein ACUVVU_04875 [Tepidimonas sp.]|uniref:hypothetical protein n=1 Tax=Tepidimonas sp. TaxID=2002775 RepID=UPI004054B5FA
MKQLLRLMADKKASDVCLLAASPALIKNNGVTAPINTQPLPVDGPHRLLAEVVCA